jgi:hypothetical protein
MTKVRVRWFLLTMLASVLGGAVVPFVAGLVDFGCGAYLAICLCCWFACLVAYYQPRLAILSATVFTGTASAVNYWGRTAYGLRGAGDPMLFWWLWWTLLAFSVPPLLLGGLVGWSNRAFEARLRQLRGEGNSSLPPNNLPN